MKHFLRRLHTGFIYAACWWTLGLLVVLLGILALILTPGVVGTTPLTIVLALACFTRASPRFRTWLWGQPRFVALMAYLKQKLPDRIFRQIEVILPRK